MWRTSKIPQTAGYVVSANDDQGCTKCHTHLRARGRESLTLTQPVAETAARVQVPVVRGRVVVWLRQRDVVAARIGRVLLLNADDGRESRRKVGEHPDEHVVRQVLSLHLQTTLYNNKQKSAVGAA